MRVVHPTICRKQRWRRLQRHPDVLEREPTETNTMHFRSQDRKCYKLPKGTVSMRTKLGNWTRLAVVVVAMAGTQTGCKSGWKMPGSDMFPWSKKPSESTLAGSSPGLSMPSNSASSPMGPAYKNNPTALAGNGIGSPKPQSPYGAPGTTGPSFNMPSNNPMASNHGPSGPSTHNGMGVVSGANGYNTGAYNMAGPANKPGGYTPQTGYGTAQQPPTAYGNMPPQNAMASMPPAYGGGPSGMPGMPPPTNSASYAPMGNGAGTPAMPAGYHAAMNTANPMQSSMPNALAGSSPLSAGPAIVNQTYNGAAPYRPGSVGRPTSYDFSNQSGGAGLPPAGVPNTANGMPNAQQMYR